MNVLGFDTSTAATAVAVLRADGAAFERVPPVAALFDRPGHGRELLPGVVAVLEEAGLGFENLDGVAVGVGPGTFTGLRIGVATARALAAARGLDLHPVSSLAALAAGVAGCGAAAPGRGDAAGSHPDAAAPVVALLDARRGEVYGAVFAGGEARLGPLVGPPERVIEAAATVAPGAPAVGDGSLRFRGPAESAGLAVASDDSPLHVVRALCVCRIGAGAPAVAPDAVLPDYIRRPDAQPSP